VECVWTAGTHAELEDIGNKGKAGGYASLDTTGNIPAEQLGNVEGMEEHGNEWHTEPFETESGELTTTQEKISAALGKMDDKTIDEIKEKLVTIAGKNSFANVKYDSQALTGIIYNKETITDPSAAVDKFFGILKGLDMTTDETYTFKIMLDGAPDKEVSIKVSPNS